MFKFVPSADVHVEVSVERPWFSEMTPDQARRKAEDIQNGIRRHIDGISGVHVIQKYVYVDQNGWEHESLYDALEGWFDEDGALEKYEFVYERPSDNGIGTRSRTDSFKELIEEAWKNPWKFELVNGPKLTPAQQKFLTKVIDAALDQKMGIKED